MEWPEKLDLGRVGANRAKTSILSARESVKNAARLDQRRRSLHTKKCFVTYRMTTSSCLTMGSDVGFTGQWVCLIHRVGVVFIGITTIELASLVDFFVTLVTAGLRRGLQRNFVTQQAIS